jgi:hypothetical protein
MRMEPYGALKVTLQAAKRVAKEMVEKPVDNFVHLRKIKKVFRSL